ncbi:eIF-2-alpha kinase activator GCN1 [Lucilia cuprina]|nr:eIF-2-alpha kinase activator GCN1 [Lucilia cuprina]
MRLVIQFDGGITPNIEILLVGATEIDFLGHHITSNGISPLPEKVKCINEYPLPKSIKELRRFLAMLNFYRKFLPHGATAQAMLNNFLKGSTKKEDNREIPWTQESINAFNNCKKAGLTCADNKQWTVSLNTVLFGLRASIKEELGSSPSEMLYGEMGQLPGEFLKTRDQLDPTSHLATIREIVTSLKSAEISHHQNNSTKFFCSHVRVRRDCYLKPPQPKYAGPFQVLQPSRTPGANRPSHLIADRRSKSVPSIPPNMENRHLVAPRRKPAQAKLSPSAWPFRFIALKPSHRDKMNTLQSKNNSKQPVNQISTYSVKAIIIVNEADRDEEFLKLRNIYCAKIRNIPPRRTPDIGEIRIFNNSVRHFFREDRYLKSTKSGAGILSFNAISPTLMPQILPLVLELFSKSLNTEKHTDFSDKTVIDIFKKGVGLKTTTPNVRLSYLQWLLACFNKCSLENDTNLTTMLLKIFEKALQNQSQIPLVSEAVCATCLLLKTDGAENDTLNNFWNIVLDINKSIFFTERFINSAPTDTLCYIVLMAEQILTKHFKSIKGNLDTLFKAFVQAITSSSDKVRSYVNSLLPEIIVSENGIMFSKSIIVELGRKLKLLEAEFDTDEQFLLSKSIEETIRLLCDIKNITSTQAVAALLEVAKCSSGEDFCAFSNTSDINIFLNALEKWPRNNARRRITSSNDFIKDNMLQKVKPRHIFLCLLPVVFGWQNLIFPMLTGIIADDLWKNVELIIPIADDLLCDHLQLIQWKPLDDVNHVMQFMVSAGLGDREEVDTIITLLPVFEDFLDKAPKSQKDYYQLFLLHLNKFKKLLANLSTTFDAISKEEAPAMIKRLLQLLVKSEKYGERRGAAYGIAGIVKGLGILSLNNLYYVKANKHTFRKRKIIKSREGATRTSHLLQCFGDPSQYVRQAQTIQLSSNGKLVLPSLLEALDEDSWRTKTALKVLGGPHTKSTGSGADAAQSSRRPFQKILHCLQSLLQTKFVHFIDAPSLALIMPVVQRAFMDRSTRTRKMAAQLLEIYLTPYLPNIIPGLKMSLLDPVPEVRAVSARALGAMDLLPWLMQTLTSESSSVDRSGAAQGLSEVVGGLGVEKLHKLNARYNFNCRKNAFSTRFYSLYCQIIQSNSKALADENEYVRDTALKAGQQLEKGLFDDNWRIRFLSVQLLGDLLYRISGVSGKMTTETASEDDNFGTEQSHAAIIRFLGNERRNRVLSGLYMAEVTYTNGSPSSSPLWKVVKTWRRVLPEIIPILERGLNSEQADQRQRKWYYVVNSLVPTVRKALSDPLTGSRIEKPQQKHLKSLHSTGLSDPDAEVAENTLDGLRQVMTINQEAPPVTLKHCQFLDLAFGCTSVQTNESQELEYCQAPIRTIMDTLMACAKSENLSTRKSSASLLSAFCMYYPGDYTQYVPQLLRSLLRLMQKLIERYCKGLGILFNGCNKRVRFISQIRFMFPMFAKLYALLLRRFKWSSRRKRNAAQGLGKLFLITNATIITAHLLVRMKAGHALSETSNNSYAIKSGDDSAIRETMLQALRSVITPAGDKMSDPIKKQICGTLIGLIGHQEDVTRSAAGGALVALLKYLTSEQVDDILRNYILLEDNDDSHI